MYRRIVSTLFEDASIVATTLSNASCEVLEKASKPVFLLCDGAAQCSEGDHVIDLTYPSLRGTVLVGDPEPLLPPTVISERAENENALFMKRSLMERLRKCYYPCTVLEYNYCKGPDILGAIARYSSEGVVLNDFERPQERQTPATYAFGGSPRTDNENARESCAADHVPAADRSESSAEEAASHSPALGQLAICPGGADCFYAGPARDSFRLLPRNNPLDTGHACSG
ncbi:hypothetical protein BDV06DRAFT_218609 [Aspergillus oleicola]